MTSTAQLANQVWQLTPCAACGGTGTRQRTFERLTRAGNTVSDTVLSACRECGGRGTERRLLRTL